MPIPENTGVAGFKGYRELPYYSWSDWDSIQLVKNTIQRLEVGYFDGPAMLTDAMLRDDRIAGCLMTRSDAVPSLSRNIVASKKPGGDKVAESVKQHFDRIFPSHMVAEAQKWRTFLGIVPIENVWSRDEDEGLVMPQWKVWHPRFMYWRWDTRSYHLITEQGTIEVTPGDGQWLLFSNAGLHRAWMHGLIRSMYVPWLLRQWAQRDSGRYSEVYGSPIKKAIVPQGALDEDKNRFFQEIANLANETTIRLPKNAEGVPFDLELLEALGTGFDGFDSIIKRTDTAIAVRVLGQNLSTEVTGGSFAAAGVHASIRSDVLKGDALGMAQVMRDQTLKAFAKLNFGDDELAPTIEYNTDLPEDLKSAADTLNTVADATTKLLANMPLDAKKLAERFKIPVLDSMDPELQVKEPLEPVAPVPPGQQPVPPQKGAAPPPPKSKKPVARATADLAGTEALSVRAAVAGQLAIDSLVDDAEKEGLLVHLREARALGFAIDKSKDFDELKKHVVEAFAGLSAEELTTLLTKAIILSELEGRFAAGEES